VYKLMHSVHAYKIIFAVLDRRLTITLYKMFTVFINNICSFINNFTLWCRILKFCYHRQEKSLLCQMFATCSYPKKVFGARFTATFLHSQFCVQKQPLSYHGSRGWSGVNFNGTI